MEEREERDEQLRGKGRTVGREGRSNLKKGRER